MATVQLANVSVRQHPNQAPIYNLNWVKVKWNICYLVSFSFCVLVHSLLVKVLPCLTTTVCAPICSFAFDFFLLQFTAFFPLFLQILISSKWEFIIPNNELYCFFRLWFHFACFSSLVYFPSTSIDVVIWKQGKNGFSLSIGNSKGTFSLSFPFDDIEYCTLGNFKSNRRNKNSRIFWSGIRLKQFYNYIKDRYENNYLSFRMIQFLFDERKLKKNIFYFNALH